MSGGLDFRVLGVVGVPNRLAQAVIELVAVDDDLLRMNGSDGGKRDREIAGILDVDDQLRPAVRPDLSVRRLQRIRGRSWAGGLTHAIAPTSLPDAGHVRS
jgi:hypothetical protein